MKTLPRIMIKGKFRKRGKSVENYSVLMSVYYKEDPGFLRSAIESMLTQTVPPEEFVLVCDGPLTTSLENVIEQFCHSYPELFRILRLEKNSGLGIALGEGLLQCRNELVARMDSDDISLPDRMEKQLEVICADPNISVLGGQIGEFSQDPDQIDTYRVVPVCREKLREFLKFRSPMNHTTVVLRRSHILKVGSYQNIPGFEDYALWIRMAAEGYLLRNIDVLCCKVRADAGMYARRGGVPYFVNARKVAQLLLEKKLIGYGEYWCNVFIRFIETVLLPSRIRRRIFNTYLRTSAKGTQHGREGGTVGKEEPLRMLPQMGNSYIKQ